MDFLKYYYTFLLPKGHLANLEISRANPAGRANEDGKVSAEGWSYAKRGRRVSLCKADELRLGGKMCLAKVKCEH